ERWSYGRLAAAVQGVATGLAREGLRPGDRILLRLGNGVAFPLAFLGAVAGGFVPVPTAAGLTAGEVTRLCAQIRPALIVAGSGAALPETPPCPVLGEAALRGFEGQPGRDWAMGDPDRLAYIIFTSGTSGTLNWTYTLGGGLFDPWAGGATALIPAEGVAAEQLPLLARRFDVTVFAAVPGVYRRILAQGDGLALPRLRHGLSAGERLPPALRARWHAATGTDLHEAMGLSECSTFLSSSPARPAPEGATGYP